MRPPVPGTVARGELRDDGPYWTGKEAGGAFVTTVPLPVDDAVRERGARALRHLLRRLPRPGGDGKGILFERGKVPTPSFHTEKLLQHARRPDLRHHHATARA